MRLRWLIAALALCAVVAFLQHWAMADYLYWRYEWFDIVMHFLGGVAIGVLLIALLRRPRPFIYAALFVLVAVGWEMFEFRFGIPRPEANYASDTALDLLMGAIGAATAYAVARLTVWRSA